MSYGIARTQNRADVRRPRWCKKCGEWKPERAHHCSVSGRCVLRMDHYCLWWVARAPCAWRAPSPCICSPPGGVRVHFEVHFEVV
jgi:hypothetical protein